MKQVTTDKIIINENNIIFTDNEVEKKITNSEYEKIKQLVDITIKNNKKIKCNEVFNSNYNKISRVPSKEINKINLMIEFEEEEYCFLGKNKLLEYLNERYNLNLEWEIDPLYIDKILEYEKIELAYGRKDVSISLFTYDRKEEIETKITIYKDKTEIINLESKNIQTNQLLENEYENFVILLKETLKEENFAICDDIINVLAIVETESEVLKPITTIVYLANKEYCILGKNKLLESLNKKYDLKIKWEKNDYKNWR